ncbi:hypothetical protein IX49_07265 [Cellulophaga lytica]|uniref:hypothetical protein n=1 Tax=Cellulophaga lytica TaxID=979 RepID=UPI0004F6188F|nr:hypothetical protein [Cellulophaga lytica]AIM60332.1 hypothetical protein IX49_07265 [Cellulophaga lytica]
MGKKENLEISLIETLTDDSLEFSGEIVELTIDQFIDNGLLKDIPFFSVFYKSLKTVQGIRDALFAMKIYKFIKEFNEIKNNEKNNFIVKISSNTKERIKVGQTLIMILEKIDELEKTQMIAKVFAAYLKEEINRSEFSQICSIIEKSFIDDLYSFVKMEKYDDISIEVQSSLSSLGLMIPIIQDLKSMYGESVIIENNRNMIVYVTSKIGIKIRKCLKNPVANNV